MHKQKYGFVYIWFDRKHKRYYVGCHWGSIDDGYICSSNWMRDAYKRRPQDFKRRILSSKIESRKLMFEEEQRYLNMINPDEIKKRYYNLCLSSKDPWYKYDEKIQIIGQKISAAQRGQKRKPHSEETKRKIAEANTGKKRTEENKKLLSDLKKGRKLDAEHRAKIGKSLKKAYDNGFRKREKIIKQKMSREEQNKMSSNRLKKLWNDPIWAEKQRKRLSDGAKSRPPRSEESKIKSRLSQLGKSKPRKSSVCINSI